MQFGGLLAVLKNFAEVQEMIIDLMKVNVFAFWLLYSEVWLWKRWFKDIGSIVLDCIVRNDNWRIVLLVLIFKLPGLIVKILPNDISRFFLISLLQTFLTLNHSNFLPFQRLFFLDESQDIFRPVLNHLKEVIHPMLWYWPFFGIILKCKHLRDNSLF